MKHCHDRGRLKQWNGPYHQVVETLMGVNRTHRMVLERQLNKTGVYRSQHQILMYIAENPKVSQKDIAKRHHVSTATIAVSLKKLENGGYIKRVVDQKDNRFNQICITPRGETVAEKSIRYFRETEERMFEGFAPEELGQLDILLGKIRQNLEQILQEKESEEQTV